MRKELSMLGLCVAAMGWAGTARAADPWTIVAADTLSGANDCVGGSLPSGWTHEKYAAFVQALRKRVAAYHIHVSSKQPAEGEFDVITLADFENPGFFGCHTTMGDCDNGFGARIGANSGTPSLTSLAGFSVWALAQSWGLDPLDVARGDIMYLYSAQDATFTDECLDLEPGAPAFSNCPQLNMMDCGDELKQNGHLKMMRLFGAAEPATIAPMVTFVSPGEGATVGPNFDLVVDIVDDEVPQVVVIEILLDGESVVGPKEFAAGELTFPVGGLADGPHTVKLDATDEDGNPVSAELQITVGSEPDPTGSETDSVGTGTTGDGTDSDGSGDGGATSDDGGCRINPRPSMLPLLLFPLFARRRR